MGQYPDAYVQYLVHFHGERDYFECHEVMEEFWKEHPGDPRSGTYVGLIQIAVGLYHSRRGNRAGAVKMLGSALTNLQPADVRTLGLDAEELERRIRSTLAAVQGDNDVYVDMNLPITDPGLLQQCQAICRDRGLVWEAPSSLENDSLIHKHTLRDRTDVIEERARQSRLRKEQGEAR
ncbi:DUF309 domain-containing protein [Paenibacillus oryzisoli]|uniref:DUF309 domain-containing protein n=1 Tax=Paenibacillus oryzisoli TaxID=1850517 RepID=UPI003D2A4EB6